MASIKKLLEIRKVIKSRKPHFIRRDTNRKKRLDKNWRKPTGIHSKLRGRFSGRAKRVSRGYRSPAEVRGLHKSGLEQHIISSPMEFESLDAKKTGLIISAAVGDRKRVIILKKAKELGFEVLNIKNPDDYVRNVENNINLRKKSKSEKTVKVKEEKKEKAAVKAEEEKKKEEATKEEAEKEEKDKLLTKREI
mgnify:CR=1 FL=1